MDSAAPVKQAAARYSAWGGISASPNVSLKPFWNGVGIKVTDGDANFGQIGTGLTIH
jgi:hypothetical protein